MSLLHTIKPTDDDLTAIKYIGDWEFIPDSVLIHIFQYLSPKELINAGLTCKSWNRVSYDDYLWKNHFCINFKVDRNIKILSRKYSWYEEYKRLTYHLPVVQTEILKNHTHQVLHVSFAHNGQLFATCSKDGFIIVWNSKYPADIKYNQDMKILGWKFTQFSQFNQSDALLLVSGICLETPLCTSGEIAVFSLEGKLKKILLTFLHHYFKPN